MPYNTFSEPEDEWETVPTGGNRSAGSAGNIGGGGGGGGGRSAGGGRGRAGANKRRGEVRMILFDFAPSFSILSVHFACFSTLR